MQKIIKDMLTEYHKSIIQSEAEVCSKFIVPFLRVLGYPTELWAQEFNVYGNAGGEKLGAKTADFLVFKDKNFSEHRTNTWSNKCWVQDNSLLVIEAKKPGKMPEDLGQAQFYTAWTKAIAYIVTDGKTLCAYYYDDIHKDYEILNIYISDMDEAINVIQLQKLSYESILSIKESGNKLESSVEFQGCSIITSKEVDLLDENTYLGIPERTKNYIKYALGRNVEGLTEVQMLSKFLKMTDSYLDNDMRYDIPEYMLSIPRTEIEAKVFLDNNINVFDSGTVTVYYRNNVEIYVFRGQLILAYAVYEDESLSEFMLDYSVGDREVEERIRKLELIKKAFTSKLLNIILCNYKNRMLLCLSAGTDEKLWKLKDIHLTIIEFWISGMKKLRAIEEYFEIRFNLVPIKDGIKGIDKAYSDIDCVYNGIIHRENCKIVVPVTEKMPKGILEISDPVIIAKEGKSIPLKESVIHIHGVTFKAVSCMILPCRIDTSRKKKRILMQGCCEYTIVSDGSQYKLLKDGRKIVKS